MKVYISADLEGITGTTAWSETELNTQDIQPFLKQMTKEVEAAIEGAIAGGATEILLKDAHDSARNLDISNLPVNCKVIRGWTGDPMCMVAGLDESFDRVIFIGYHSKGGSQRNPLAHTLVVNADVKINGEYASEFLINTYAAGLHGVPVAFVSGDVGLTEEIRSVNEKIVTFATKEGVGGATVNVSPNLTIKETRILVEEAMRVDREALQVKLPERFVVEIIYRDHARAYRNSFYPGATFKPHNTVEFVTDDYYEVLRILQFLT
ncbi:M55 family metallopeptidase [Ureibacillus sinduriensis]|uniref:Amino acid amidase n=1 Tax=Ureibacillus sinduriensis BLB-1 = JCM 15800 TaxID=1384057 RepID=A0A0A3HT67_9BACL|nr:M55 family metallopeptidase [Ureibacillus sinduriensis]KGR74395.1 amino acid amidase [Ureibacillus sinduriensis BLB-1 = JCM 15800]